MPATQTAQPAETQRQPAYLSQWQQVASSPDYQKADDAQREHMRQQVFFDTIAPHIAEWDMDKAWAMFDAQTQPKGDPSSGGVHDFLRMAESGALASIGDTAAGVTLGSSNPVSDYFHEWSEDAQNKASPSAIESAQNFGVDYDAEKGLHFKEGSTLQGFMGNLGQGAGSLLPMVAGGVLGRGMGVAGKALGGIDKGTKAAVAARNMDQARKIIQRGQSIEKWSGRAGYGVAGGLGVGGGTGQQAYNEVMAMRPDQLQQSEKYNNYAQTMTPEQAQTQLATDAAHGAFTPAFALGTLTSAVADPMLEKLVTGKAVAGKAGISTFLNKLKDSRLTGMAKGMAVEAPTEVADSGGQQYYSNVAQQQQGLDVDPMNDVMGKALTGGLLGAAIGGPLGGIHKPKKRPTHAQTQLDLDNAQQARQQLEDELKGDLTDEKRAELEAELEKAYRTEVDLEAVRDTLSEEAEAQAKEKPTPSDAGPKVSESEPDTQGASEDTQGVNEPWVSTDIGDQVRATQKTIRQMESDWRRKAQNGATAEDAQEFESALGKQKALLKRLQALSRNQTKQDLFGSKEDFYDWIERKNGTPEEQVGADNELKARRIKAHQGKHFTRLDDLHAYIGTHRLIGKGYAIQKEGKGWRLRKKLTQNVEGYTPPVLEGEWISAEDFMSGAWQSAVNRSQQNAPTALPNPASRPERRLSDQESRHFRNRADFYGTDTGELSEGVPDVAEKRERRRQQKEQLDRRQGALKRQRQEENEAAARMRHPGQINPVDAATRVIKNVKEAGGDIEHQLRAARQAYDKISESLKKDGTSIPKPIEREFQALIKKLEKDQAWDAHQQQQQQSLRQGYDKAVQQRNDRAFLDHINQAARTALHNYLQTGTRKGSQLHLKREQASYQTWFDRLPIEQKRPIIQRIVNKVMGDQKGAIGNQLKGQFVKSGRLPHGSEAFIKEVLTHDETIAHARFKRGKPAIGKTERPQVLSPTPTPTPTQRYSIEKIKDRLVVKAPKTDDAKFGKNGLGGVYDPRRSGWSFPDHQRQFVKETLQRWQGMSGQAITTELKRRYLKRRFHEQQKKSRAGLARMKERQEAPVKSEKADTSEPPVKKTEEPIHEEPPEGPLQVLQSLTEKQVRQHGHDPVKVGDDVLHVLAPDKKSDPWQFVLDEASNNDRYETFPDFEAARQRAIDVYHELAGETVTEKPEKADTSEKPAQKTAESISADDGRYIPPDSHSSVHPDWIEGRKNGFSRSQKKLMAVVGQALDKGLYLNTDVYDFVKKRLAEDLKDYDFSIGIDDVERGAFGYDVYMARQAEEGRRTTIENQEKTQQFNPGQVLNNIKLWIGGEKHNFSTFTITSVDKDEGSINFTGKKRGTKKTFTGVVSGLTLSRSVSDQSEIKQPSNNQQIKPQTFTPTDAAPSQKTDTHLQENQPFTEKSDVDKTDNTEPATDTPRQARQARRKRKLIDIDEELSQAADELAEVFRKEAGKLGSGLDPVLAAKVLLHGAKVGTLLVKKGAIKFADWADNVLAMMDSKGIHEREVAPHLKSLYQAVSVNEQLDDALAEQMDSRKEVRAFDLETLLEPLPDATPEQIRDIENRVVQHVLKPDPLSDREGMIKKVLGNYDEQNARLAAKDVARKAALKLRKESVEDYKTFVQSGNIDNVVNGLMDFRAKLWDRLEPDSFDVEYRKPDKKAVLNDSGYIATAEFDNPLFNPTGIGGGKFYQSMHPYPEKTERKAKAVVTADYKRAFFDQWLADHNRVPSADYPAEIDRLFNLVMMAPSNNHQKPVKQTETTPVKAKVPPVAVRNDMAADYGTDLNGYSDKGAEAKALFLKNGKTTLTRLGKLLGWDSGFKNKSGVSVGEAGPAVSGAVNGKWTIPDTNNQVRVNVVTKFNIPLSKSHPQAVSIVWSTNKDRNKGLTGNNHWEHFDIPLDQLADKIKKTFEQAAENATGIHAKNDREPSRATPRYGADLTTVTHTTKKGKELTGVVAKDMTKQQAMDIDPGTFMKNGGWFLRNKRLDAYNEAKSTEGATDENPGTTGDRSLGGVSADKVPAISKGGPTGEGSRDHSGQSSRPDQHPDRSDGLRGSETESVLGTDLHSAGAVSDGETGGKRLGEGREGGINTGAVDYTITDTDGLESSRFSDRQKFRDNLAAIKLVKELGDRAATKDQQAILAKYIGWGGIKQAFFRDDGTTRKGWDREAAELKKLLSPEEYNAARASILNAHYTIPSVVSAIYSGLDNIGFSHGRILEPSMGTGNFFGLMPAPMKTKSNLVGVELDAITGAIAKKLYGGTATIHDRMPFQDFALKDGSYDLVIGNPPFGDETITDRSRKDISGQRIHNYFFAKGMKALRPGGAMAMVVSKGFMDSSKNQRGREAMYREALLLGAYRLPNEAFKNNANADVTTDIIFLQKRDKPLEGEIDFSDRTAAKEAGPDYRNRELFIGTDGNDMHINQYFVTHSDNLLGDMMMNKGRYGPELEPAMAARPDFDWKKELSNRVNNLNRGRANKPYQSAKNVTVNSVSQVATHTRDIENADINGLYLDDNGDIHRRLPDLEGEQQSEQVTGYINTSGEEKTYKPADMKRLQDAVKLARITRNLINQQITDASDPELDGLRQQLNESYDAFVKNHKMINRPVNKRLLNTADLTIAPMLMALENSYKKEKKVNKKLVAKEHSVKADIFTRRTQEPYRPVTQVGSPQEALIVSLAETGRVDMEKMSQLSGESRTALAAKLDGLIFNDPQQGWVSRDEYLSGNVKKKLRQAKEAGYHENVAALEKVQPADVPAENIVTSLGASWQTPEVITAFFEHLGGENAKATFIPGRNFWAFKGSNTAEARKWGTEELSVSALLPMILNNKAIAIYKTVGLAYDQKRVLDTRATDAANAKAMELQNEFHQWLWQEPERRNKMVRRYNDLINTTVNREYDGSFLTFPGKISDDIIKLLSTQSNAVWRTLQSPTTLLDHVVGSGKTFTMIAAAMEMKRTGLAKKPMMLVPNHLVAQWAEDFARLYPNSRVLAATKADFSKHKRKELLSRIATGDWDAVIVAHSSYGRIGIDPKTEETFLKEQLRDMNIAIAALREAEGKRTRSVSDAEKQRKKLEEKIKILLENTNKDEGLTWEETGVDALFVDEAHEFKNLQFMTGMNRIKNINPQGSNKAQDLFIKTRSMLGRTGGRNLVFATGTPISNSMAELFTMQRYLSYEGLKDSGLNHFDAWARTFGMTHTQQERKSSGKFGSVSRFSKFINLPELMKMYRQFADKISNEDIKSSLEKAGKGVHIPKIKGGNPAVRVAKRSIFQEAYMGLLERRFANMPPDPRVDNPLKATNDARKAALDMRMVFPDLPDNPDSKINKAVDGMMTLYHEWAEDKGTQLMFCDLSTPKSSQAKEVAEFRKQVTEAAKKEESPRKNRVAQMSPEELYAYLEDMAEEGNSKAINRLGKITPDHIAGWTSQFDVYNDMKEKLIGRGVPADEIAFIHDANTDLQKEELFAKVNSGEVRFLFGSTAKMGAGTNVQERLVGLHHLDAPWRPSDLEQREGRIIRQGNKLFLRDPEGFEVEILRYATEQTYDVNMWQTLEVKARFIEQVRNGDTSQREAADVAGESATAAEMKAASSGDPRIMEQVELGSRLKVLDNLRQTHGRDKIRATMEREWQEDAKKKLPKRIAILQKDINRLEPVPKKGAALTQLNGKTFETATDAANWLKQQVLTAAKQENNPLWGGMTLANYRGFKVYAELGKTTGSRDGKLATVNAVNFHLTGHSDRWVIKDADIEELSWNGVFTRFNNNLKKLEENKAERERDLDNIDGHIEAARQQQQAPFKYEAEYQQNNKRNQQLIEELGAEDKSNEEATALPEYHAFTQMAEDYSNRAHTSNAEWLTNLAMSHRAAGLAERIFYSKPGTENKRAKEAMEQAKALDILPGSKTMENATQKAAEARESLAQKKQEEAKEQEAKQQQEETAEGKYRLADEGTQGLKGYQAKTLQAILNKAVGEGIHVIQSERQLPKHVQQQIARDGVSGRVKGLYDNGKLYVIADNASSMNDALRTALHERVGHKGVRGLLGDAFHSTLDQVYRSIPKRALGRLKQRYAQQLAGKPALEQRRLLADEYLAHMAETNPRNGWVRKAIATIAKWLRTFFPSLKLTDSEIRQLLIDARQQLQSNQAPRPGTRADVRYKLDGVLKMDKARIDTLKHTSRSAFDLVRKAGLGALGGRQITEIYQGLFKAVEDKLGINPLTSVDKLMQNMSADRSRWASDAETIDRDWAKLAKADPKAYDILSDTMHRATLHQVDPRKPYAAMNKSIKTLQAIVDNATSDQQRDIFSKRLKAEKARKAAHAQLQKAWAVLGDTEGAQALFEKAERYYKRQRAATKKALVNRVTDLGLDALAKASALKQIEAMFAHDLKKGPYFPLQRFGDYVITATDAAGDPYRAHFESKYARDQAKLTLEQEGYTVDFAGMRADFKPGQLAGVGQFAGKLMQALDSNRNNDIDPDAKQAFMAEVNQIALSLMPELSAAKRGMHRKGVAGYHENARRVFDSVALTTANRLSRLNYGWQIEAQLERIKTVAGEGSDSTLSDHEKDIAMQVHNELRKRHETIMNPTGHPLAAYITNAGFFAYMGGSIGAGLVNMTQNLLIGLPQMGAKHGFRKTARVMAGVTGDLFRYGGKKPKGVDGLLHDAWFSLEGLKANKNITADEIAMIEALIHDGTIESTQAHTLAQMADADLKPDQIKRRDWMTKASRASGMFFHNAEVINRQVAALTAYRLMKQAKMETVGSDGQVTGKALDAVRKQVFDTHFDYSSYNRPRYFKGNWAKVFLMFKQYSQNTTYFLTRNMYQALKGESPENKKQAWRTLGSTLGMHALFAGLLGLPGVSVAMGLAGLAMGDEDDPVDPEAEFRIGLYNTMAGMFGQENGKTVAHALSKGVFNAFAGIDMSARTSINDLWYRGSNYDMPAREEAMYMATNVLIGPVGSLGVNAWAGVDKIANGDVWRGMEGLMPKFVRDGMRTRRYALEGNMDASGNPLVEDFSPWELGNQLIGFSPSRNSEAYEAKSAYTGIHNKLNARRQRLLTDLSRAETAQERRQVMANIDHFNDIQRQTPERQPFVITPKQRRQSMKSRAKRKEQSVPGVGYVPDNKRPMMERMTGFAAF